MTIQYRPYRKPWTLRQILAVCLAWASFIAIILWTFAARAQQLPIVHRNGVEMFAPDKPFESFQLGNIPPGTCLSVDSRLNVVSVACGTAGSLTGGTLTGALYTAQDPAAAVEVSNRRFTLSSADSTRILSALTNANKPKPPFTVTPVPTKYTMLEGTPSLSANYVAPNASVLGLRGCSASQYIVSGSTPPDSLMYHCQSEDGDDRAFSQPIIVNDDFFDFVIKDNEGGFRVVVDGVPLSDYFTMVGNTGNYDSFRVQLDGYRHRVDMEYAIYTQLAGYYFPSGSAGVSATDLPAAPKVAEYGDSFMEPTIGGFDGSVGYMDEAARLVGWDGHNYSEGATGYIANASGSRMTIGQHVATDGASDTFNLCLFGGGINDSSIATQSAIQAAAQAAWEGCYTANPLASVLVLSSWYGSASGVTSQITQTDAALYAGYVAEKNLGRRIFWIASPPQENWYPPNPADCSSLYSVLNCTVSYDTTHPGQFWHRILAQKLALRVVDTLWWFVNMVDTSSPLVPNHEGIVRHAWPELTGTITVTSGSATISGTGSKFLTELQPGATFALYGQGGNVSYTVGAAGCTSDTSCTLTSAVPSYWIPGGGASGTSAGELTTYPTIFSVSKNGNVQGNSATFSTLKATSGTRYLCVDTNGKVVSQASACSGT